MNRIDSARTFVRKYQQSYNAHRPPEKHLRKKGNELEKSLKSESLFHSSEKLDGDELPNDFHALMELDKTLKSESRFVYPDGRAFVPSSVRTSQNRPESSQPRPELKYQLQPYENASMIPVKVPLPAPPNATHNSTQPQYEIIIDENISASDQCDSVSPLQTMSTRNLDSPAASAITLASERSKRRKETEISHAQQDDDTALEFDIDKAFRRNRRKFELLDKMGLRTEESFDRENGTSNVYSGPEELDLLLNGLNSVSSSRPTTAETGKTRPSTVGTLHGESHLLPVNRDYGFMLQQERHKYKQQQRHVPARRQHHETHVHDRVIKV